MNSYNSYTAAFAAAFAELTSDNARRYYSLRAQQDIQTAFVLIIQLGCMAYALGAQCRTWCNESANFADLSSISKSAKFADFIDP